MDVGNLLNIVLAASTIGVALVAGLSYGSRKALRESNSDLRDRVSDLEKANTLMRVELAQLKAHSEAEMADLRAKNETLRGLVTGEVHWSALGESMDQLIRDAHKHWSEERSYFRKILEASQKIIELAQQTIRRLGTIEDEVKE